RRRRRRGAERAGRAGGAGRAGRWAGRFYGAGGDLSMRSNRRHFMKLSASAGLAAGAAACGRGNAADVEAQAQDSSSIPPSIRALKTMTDGIVPITLDERRARVEKARRLMAENRLDAIMVEAGTSLFYFTGVRWGQ